MQFLSVGFSLLFYILTLNIWRALEPLHVCSRSGMGVCLEGMEPVDELSAEALSKRLSC